MLYILKAAITLALLYSCFFVFLSKETFHRFNRSMLVGIMLVSLILPLCHFTTQHPTVLNEEVYEMQTYIEQDATPVIITASKATPVTWMQALTWLYWAGVAVMLTLTLLQTCSLVRFLHGGIRQTDGRGNTVILHNRDALPFSIFRYIVMNVKDYETERRYILAHEQEHIRLGHTYDLLLCEAMKTLLWFNPFIWFLSRDLRAIHEYEADQAVINQGIDAKSYQQLLVMKVVGDRLQPFTNNLNHGSLKKRILMMYQKPSNRWLMLKAICAVPVVALTVNAFATPAETTSVEDMVKTLEAKEVPVLNEVKEQPTDLASDTLKPLFVVDGKIINIDASQPGKDINAMDEEDVAKLLRVKSDEIESMSVLTGVCATALFGEKAKNGAIVIQTKTDKEKPDSVVVVKAIPDKEKSDRVVVVKAKPDKEMADDNDNSSEVCLVVEETAKYPGGEAALMQFLSKNTRYPTIAKENGAQGRVLVQFIVNKDGTCSDFQIVKGDISPNTDITVVAQKKGQTPPEGKKKAQMEKEANKALEEEAIRVCSLMPKWEPAKQKGRVVRQRLTIPITFHLQ